MFVPSNLLKDLIRFWFEQEESRFFSVSMEDQRNFVLLSCAGTDGLDFLEASLLAGLLKTGNRFFVPCLGLANSHLDRFRYLGAEIYLLKLHGTNGNGDLGTDLVLDLLGALSGGLMGLKLAGNEVKPQSLSCSDTVTWQLGYTLTQRIRGTKFVGETGSVILDADTGLRTNLTVSVMKMTKQGIATDAFWSPKSGYLKSKGKFRVKYNLYFVHLDDELYLTSNNKQEN